MNPTDHLPAIEQALRDALGTDYTIRDSAPASGGCIHTALSVSSGRQRHFVKLAPLVEAPLLAAEADGLTAIAATGTVRTPAVIAHGKDDAAAFLILEFLDLRPLASADDGRRFAEALAAMHAHTGEHFGWPRDNFIGRTPQDNTQSDSWSRFVIDRRLRPQFALARANGFTGDLQKLGDRLCERVAALFLEYRPQPALLHGDLWHGNAGITAAGEPAVFDPAVHCGDRDADLAMSALFGGFPASFYATCHTLAPHAPNAEARRMLYSLYHVLNHLNLFGRSYLGEALRLAKRLDDAL